MSQKPKVTLLTLWHLCAMQQHLPQPQMNSCLWIQYHLCPSEWPEKCIFWSQNLQIKPSGRKWGRSLGFMILMTCFTTLNFFFFFSWLWLYISKEKVGWYNHGKNIRLGIVAQVSWALWAANLTLIQRQCAIILQLAVCVYDGKIQQTQTSVVTSLIFR